MPLIPTMVTFGLLPVPTRIIEFAFNQLTRSIGYRHPSMFERLGSHAGKKFVLQPTDLPFLIIITLDPIKPAVSVVRSCNKQHGDARIAGPIAAFIGLANGFYDGDALFFSGDLTIEGDVEVILALRNALDNAEIDLLQEGVAILGPLAGLAERLMRPAAPLIERYTGLTLTRSRSTHP